MDWKVKARIFRVLSQIPFGRKLHYQLQRRVTKEWPRPSPVLDLLLIAARRVHEASGGGREHFLEIGAGNDLAVAVALRLLGVQRVTCIDVSRLARVELIRHAANYLAARLEVPAPVIDSWSDVEAFGISYLAPCTLTSADLAAASIDCFFSIDTLEHIPLGDLPPILIEAKRLLRPGGRFVHLIDYSDHYARGDDGLSRFNFLTYSDSDWKPFNSPFQYVNRLRHSEFLELFRNAGLTLVHAEADRAEPQQAIVERLARQFRGRDLNDLFTLRAMLVAAVVE